MENLRKTRKNRKRNIKRAGGQLPQTRAEIITLPPISSLENIYKNDKPNSNQKGGFLQAGYVGLTWGNLVVSNFPITSDNISSFKRIAHSSSMDCVISALQIIGIFDYFTANIFRITKIGKMIGLDLEEIELIFTLRTNKRFTFLSTSNVNEFIHYVNVYLQPGNVIFCGVEYETAQVFTPTTKHVFLIGKDLNNRIIKIDPAVSDPFCYLDENIDCINKFASGTIGYYLLFNYTGYLTEREAEEIGIKANPTFQHISQSTSADNNMDVD